MDLTVTKLSKMHPQRIELRREMLGMKEVEGGENNFGWMDLEMEPLPKMVVLVGESPSKSHDHSG